MNPQQRRALAELKEVGEKLAHELEQEFPGSDRCLRCGFRRPYHDPANHEFMKQYHPLVVTMRGYMERVGYAIEAASTGQ